MDQKTKDAGTIEALMIRMKEYRIPRAKRMQERVNAGEKLSDVDIEYLNRVYDQSRDSAALFERHPEYDELRIRALDLFSEIIAKALENEKA
jgi:hypothetical protein